MKAPKVAQPKLVLFTLLTAGITAKHVVNLKHQNTRISEMVHKLLLGLTRVALLVSAPYPEEHGQLQNFLSLTVESEEKEDTRASFDKKDLI